MPDASKRQIFQTAMQVVIPGGLALLNALIAIGGFPTPEQIYMATLGALLSGLLAAAGLFGISRIQYGGIENERIAVKALNSDKETGELLPGTTARDLAKPLPETIKA